MSSENFSYYFPSYNTPKKSDELTNKKHNELVMSLKNIERAYNVTTGEQNLYEFLHKFVYHFKIKGRDKASILIDTGQVLSSKTHTTNFRAIPFIKNELANFNLHEKTKLHHIEWDLFENKAAELVIKIVNNQASAQERQFFYKQIELLKDEKAFDNSEEDFSSQIYKSIPKRYFLPDPVRLPDSRLFLALTRTFITLEIAEILRTEEDYVMIVIDAPSGTEYKDQISDRSYATRIFKELAAPPNGYFYGVDRLKYQLAFANLVAGPKIYLLALYRHFLSNAKSLEEAREISRYFGYQNSPKDIREWRILGSGGSIEMSFAADEEFIKQMDILGYGRTKVATIPKSIDEVRLEEIEQRKNLFVSEKREQLIMAYSETVVDAYIDAFKITNILIGILPNIDRKILMHTQWRLKIPLMYMQFMSELLPELHITAYVNPDVDIDNVKSLKELVDKKPYLLK